MSTTILTSSQMDDLATEILGYSLSATEQWFVEAIEQAVLRSEQVQAWKRDAERYHTMRRAIRPDGLTVLVGGFDLCLEKLDSAIDAAMEKQS